MSEVSGVSSTSSTSNRGKGLEAMTGQDFLKLLITQLVSQDPMEPMKNDELMRQLSAIRQLESNNQIASNFSKLLSHQQLSSASVLVGKNILGVSTDGYLVEGKAERILMDAAGIRLQVNGYEVPLAGVMAVEDATAGKDPADAGSVLGDINGDGSVTESDRQLLLARISGQDAPGEFKAYDLNGDGVINQTDLDLIETLLNSVAPEVE